MCRIVQNRPEFFKIKPGLWALTKYKNEVFNKLAISKSTLSTSDEIFSHSYYLGLIVEIGNLKNYETFVPAQDKNRKFLETKLTEMATLEKMKFFTYKYLSQKARTIDVTWLNEYGFPNTFF